MSVRARLRRLEGPRRGERFTWLIVNEDEEGRWWEWGEDPPVEVDRDALPPLVRVVVIATRPDGPQ